MTYHKFIPKILKMYQTLSLHSYIIFCLENVEISMQVSNRQLLHRNDVETMSFRGTISDWILRFDKNILKMIKDMFKI